MVDPQREEEYNRGRTMQEEKQAFLDRLLEELEKLRREKEAIDGANSTFAVFLKHRSITPYNDAYEGYLNYLTTQATNGADFAKVNF